MLDLRPQWRALYLAYDMRLREVLDGDYHTDDPGYGCNMWEWDRHGEIVRLLGIMVMLARLP